MFDVYVYAGALSAAEDHFRQASWEKKEALGLLVGRAFCFEGRAYAVAEEYVTAQNDATAVSVRFSRDAFSNLSEKLSNGKQVVGWIHSHPDLGCFLSHTDVATHEAFFSEAYHFAFVVDPVRHEKTCFKVKHSQSMPVSFAVIRKK